jgi:hypothetical protein
MAGPSIINLNNTTPAAPTGQLNVLWQGDTNNPRNVSAAIPNIGGIDARTTTSETIALASQGKLVTLSNASAIAVALTSSSVAAGYFAFVYVIGAGTATLTPSTGTINGGSNLPLVSGQSCMLWFNGTNWTATFSTAALSTPYDIAIPISGKMDAASTTYLVITFTRAVTLPGNCVGSKGTVLTNPAATTTYTLSKNGSSFGTVVVSTAGAFTFTTTSGAAVSFAVGDYLTITAPAPDTNLSDFEVTLAALR